MARRTLYLLRHGEYSVNTPPTEEPDGALTTIGRRQAERLAERAASLPIRVVHHSTAMRAVETAGIIAGRLPGIPVQPEAILRECVPGVPAGLEAHFAHIPAEFIERGAAQAEAAFERYFQPLPEGEPGQHELIVAHGNLLSYLICRALNAPADSWVRIGLNLCSLSEVLVGTNGLMKLMRLNDCSHLPPEMQFE